MKEFKIGKEDFVSFYSNIVIPKWVYNNFLNLRLPSCKNNNQKVSFLITYYLLNHKN